MKRFALFSVPLLLVLAAVSAPAKSPQGPANAAKQAADSLAGKKLFARDCALCHGTNGNGQTDLAKSMSLSLHDWTDPKTLADKSDQDLFAIIRKGKDKMPQEDKGRASDDQVKSIIEYIRGLSKQAAEPAPSPSN